MPVAYVLCNSIMPAQTQNFTSRIENYVRLQGRNRFVGFLCHGVIWRNPSLVLDGQIECRSVLIHSSQEVVFDQILKLAGEAMILLFFNFDIHRLRTGSLPILDFFDQAHCGGAKEGDALNQHRQRKQVLFVDIEFIRHPQPYRTGEE